MKVLLADENQERADSVADSLQRSSGIEILRLDGRDLVASVSLHEPDVVIVDMNRPDRDSLEGIRQLSHTKPLPVVFFVDREDPAFMEAAINAGVSSYNLVGASLPDVRPIVQTAVLMFRRYQQIESELRKAESSLMERAVIERAKAVLMQKRRVSEPDAYRWLRRQAMDNGRRIADIAAEILRDNSGTTPNKPTGAPHGR